MEKNDFLSQRRLVIQQELSHVNIRPNPFSRKCVYLKKYNQVGMGYHTSNLPQAIRQQAEDFIRYLLWKNEQTEMESQEPMSSKKTAGFIKKWKGAFASERAGNAKDEYLSDKYL
ncbi:MAG: hypothetical protein AAFY70_18785 [Bacteroidota bacterium]